MAQPARSTFVTVVGWIFLVLSAFGALMMLMEGFMMHMMMSTTGFEQSLQQAQTQQPDMPAFMLLMTRHMEWFLAIPFVVFTATVAASLGLVKRWNWGRILFIVMMALGIVWNLGSVVLQFFWAHTMQNQFAQMQHTANAPDMAAMPDMHGIVTAMMIFGAIIAIGFCILYGWIIKRLVSARVVAEFKS